MMLTLRLNGNLAISDRLSLSAMRQRLSASAAERGERVDQKIARLPKPTRDMLNLMIDDGLPYRVIIEELGETVHDLKAGSLANWVQGGYEEYLKERQNIEGVKTQAEFAADLLRELGNIDPSVIHRACMIVAGFQMSNAIREYGDEALKEMLQSNPATYVNLLNALCNVSNSALKYEDHRQRVSNRRSEREDRLHSSNA